MAKFWIFVTAAAFVVSILVGYDVGQRMAAQKIEQKKITIGSKDYPECTVNVHLYVIDEMIDIGMLEWLEICRQAREKEDANNSG